MTLREVLQIEIWSAKTSRKLLIDFAVSMCVFWVGVRAYASWLTPMELRAGRAALVDVDALQNSSSMTDQEFGVAEKQAEQSVQHAIQAAWTSRDRHVALELNNYLQMASVERVDRKAERIRKLAGSKDDTNRDLRQEMVRQLRFIHDLDSKLLHQELR